MNYEQNYFDLINSRKSFLRSRKDGIYYELHHILPKSMGGTNEENNLVLFTAREHYLAHYMLWKIYKNRETAGAFFFMSALKTGKFITSRMYEALRKDITIKFKGENNPFFGKKHSKETLKILSEKAQLNTGNKNPNFGNKWTDEQKKQAALIKIGKYAGDKNPKAKPCINLDTGEIFSCQKYASEKYNLTEGLISGVCNGAHKRAGGYRWAFYKEEKNEL